MNKFFEIIENFGIQDEEIKKDLEKIIKYKTFKSGETISPIGSKQEDIYFLSEGIIRLYFELENGKQYNKSIVSEYQFSASFSSLIKNESSKVAIECLSDCKIFTLNYSKILELEKKYPKLYIIHIKVLNHFFVEREYENYLLATKDAKQRYLELRKRIPNIDEKVTQYHIASYLGITPVQLSRVRKKLIEENLMD